MEPKKQVLQYRFYFLWSFITVTSVPFFLGSLIAYEIFPVYIIYIMEFKLETSGILGWVFAIGFWLVLLLLIKRKSHDQDNPLYMLLRSHATIGGTLQAITSLPAMIYLPFNPGGGLENLDAFMYIGMYWLFSSIVSGLVMLLYDIFIVYKIYKIHRENIDFFAVIFSRRFIFVLVTIFLYWVGIVLWYLFTLLF